MDKSNYNFERSPTIWHWFLMLRLGNFLAKVRRRLLWFFYLRKMPQISYYAFSRVAPAQPNGLSSISKGGRNKGPNSMIYVWWYEMRLYDMRVMIWDETTMYIRYVQWLMFDTKLFAKNLAAKKKKFIDICWKLKTTELLLHMHKTRCIFHTYSSTVEIRGKLNLNLPNLVF